MKKSFNITNSYLRGFIESEGSFYLVDGKYPTMSLSQHSIDKQFMLAVRDHIGVGYVREVTSNGRHEVVYTVTGKAMCNTIIPLVLERGGLYTQKKFDLLKLKPAVESILPERIPASKLLAKINDKLPDPEWLTGFTDGDGSFYTTIVPASDYKVGFQARAHYKLIQHSRDHELLQVLKSSYFGDKGTLHKHVNNCSYLSISGIRDIQDKVIPHFNNFPLQTRKASDFKIFKESVDIIATKQHLTVEGITLLKQLHSEFSFSKQAVGDLSKSSFDSIHDVKVKDPSLMDSSDIHSSSE